MIIYEKGNNLNMQFQIVLYNLPFKTFFLLLVGKGIVSFERENRDLSDAVIVKETLDLVAACDRVLSKPGGSMLMCGKSGVGRRSAVSIVSALHQAKWINLKMGKKYDEFFLFISLHNYVHTYFPPAIRGLTSQLLKLQFLS